MVEGFDQTALGYTLIDTPITPYSSEEKINLWIKYCEQQLAENPSDEQWMDALYDARRILAMKNREK